MPTLVKEILPEETYYPNSNKGRIKKHFSAEYLNKLAVTSNKMIAAGLSIPAPFDHNKQAVPKIKADAKPESAFNNAGYWEAFYVSPNDKGVPTLYGVLDVAGSDSEPDSPYYKAKNNLREVSINAILDAPYVDGLGRSWTDGILHAALVTHAVVPGQKPFEDTNGLIVSMSMTTGDDEPDSTLINQIRSALQEGCSLVVPEVSDAKTFLQYLLVAALQLKETKPHDGSSLVPVPIYMSTGDNDMALTLQQAEALVASKAVNPVTKIAFTMEDLGFKPAPLSMDLSTLQAELTTTKGKLDQATTLVKAFANKLKNETQAAIQRRIDKLIETGVITKEYADSMLKPRVVFEMSIDPTTHDIADHQLEITLSTLEALPKPSAPAKDQFGFDIEPQSLNSSADTDVEEALKEFSEYLN